MNEEYYFESQILFINLKNIPFKKKKRANERVLKFQRANT